MLVYFYLFISWAICTALVFTGCPWVAFLLALLLLGTLPKEPKEPNRKR